MHGERVLVLLRGINVGGRHPAPMAELRALFAKLGCSAVSTYIQSGNLVCTANAPLHPAPLASLLADRFGFPIPVAVRGSQEFDACILANPFAAEDVDTLHAVFLEAPLGSAAFEALRAKRAGDEDLAASARELFLYLPHGFGRSKLALACTAPGIAGNPTVRNWKTVLQLQRMLAA